MAVSCVRIRASISDLGDPLGHPPINAVLLSVSSTVVEASEAPSLNTTLLLLVPYFETRSRNFATSETR
eukprot:7128080-Prorocentrum_lima.AAC.1